MLLWTNVSLFRLSGRPMGNPWVNLAFPWTACGLHLSAVSIWLLRTQSHLSQSPDLRLSTGPVLAGAATITLGLSALCFTVEHCRGKGAGLEVSVELASVG